MRAARRSGPRIDTTLGMNFDKFSAHDLPTGGMALLGVVLLFLVFRAGTIMRRLVFLLVAVALFSGAYWWHTQR